MIHHLVIRPRSARTACGLIVDVYFPGTGEAVSFKPLEHRLVCTTDVAQASCLKCHQVALDGATRARRDSMQRPAPINPREPKRFERKNAPHIVTGDHDKCVGCVTVEECIDEGCAAERPARCAATADSLVKDCEGAACKAHGRCCWQ